MALPVLLEAIAEGSAAAGQVRIAFERLGAIPGSLERLEADETLAAATARVVEASRSLSRLLVTDPEALDTVGLALAGRQSASCDLRAAVSPGDLSRRKHLRLLAIATRDLAGLDGLEEVGAALSDMADDVLASACDIATVDGRPAGGSGPELPLAVVAMGKHGARELNYSSDVDIVLVGADDTGIGRRLVQVASGAFRVDTDLRPEGRNGVLVRSLDSYRSYWQRWARPWEFQALLKARAAGGNPAIGAAFEQAASEALWQRRLDADDLAELRSLKARTERLVSERGLSVREIKRGQGGIRDIEFSVQLLQLVHGAADPGIRLPATIPALSELAAAGYVDGGDAAALGLAYRFFRTVEHRLQLVEEAQVHTIPADPASRRALAASLGLGPGTEGFDEVLVHYQSTARAIHERLFFRPLLEAFGADRNRSHPGGGALPAAAAEERLSAFGFSRAGHTRTALRELTGGLTRSSRLMQQMLPVLLSFLSEAPDPDGGLLALRTLASAPHRRDVLVSGFRDSPELARRLCRLLGTGRQVAELVGRRSETALRLGEDADLVPPAPENLLERAMEAVDQPTSRARGALRQLVESETLRIAAADVLGIGSLEKTSRSLAALGDAALGAALLHAACPVPMALFALGRLGGRELSFGSDLDVLVVYDGRGPGDAAAAETAALSLLRFLNGETPAERILTVDSSLRPEGRQGPLARSLDAHAEYHSARLETWERQALLRLRPVAGDPPVIDAYVKLCDSAVWEQPFGEKEIRDLRRMKARVERERVPAGEDPQFHLKLGRGSLSDVEWTTQLLQLLNGIRQAGTLEAISALRAGGHLDEQSRAALAEAHRFLSLTRNRWHLVGNHVAGAGGIVTKLGSDSLPQQPSQLSRLARALSTTPSELREEYRRVTRRARRVTEERFYGL